MKGCRVVLREQGNEVLELTNKENKQSGGLLQLGAAKDFFFFFFITEQSVFHSISKWKTVPFSLKMYFP